MKSIILVTLALVAAAAAIPDEKQVAEIISSILNQTPNGDYNYDFKSNDGVSRSEQGTLTEVLNEKNEPQKVVTVRGQYSYPDPETGREITITYEADQDGFRATGDSIPKVPETS